ncbi:DUF4007 family protein [bacterium]|nr:DUF4007 family protein [bacterium]MBU1434348.1 DUF4007 family protein [bacterium]MBU1503739.1 DUF4007 family protein [bacterium]
MKKIKTSFSGHDKFDCKIDWIVKGLEAFNNDNKILLLSNIEKGIETLGLGINMIKSLNHWLKVFGLINDNGFTELGQMILEKDPYLENTDILWILHWNLVKNKENTTLYYMFFNQIYLYRFTKEDIFNNVSLWLEQNEIKLSPSTLKADIDVFLRMYNNTSNKDISMNLLSDLNILTQFNDKYILNINSTVKISNDVFIYILNDYIHTFKKANIESISIDDIQRGEVSIQKSLCMSENTLFSKINNISNITNGSMSYSEASGIRQIYINNTLNNHELLSNILNKEVANVLL